MIEKEAWEYLNELAYMPAKLKGKHRALASVDTIVCHRMDKLSASAGAKYVTELGDGRMVSWHYSVHPDNGMIIRHLPIQSTGAHCLYPSGTNRRSVGIEIGGPFGSIISSEAHESIRVLCSAIISVAPIKTIASHEYLDSLGPRKNRKDPGREFNWRALEGLGVELKFELGR